MRFSRVEIILNILFWVLTSWMIISFNSKEVIGTEYIDGEKITTAVRDWELVWYGIIGQVFYALLFYGEFFLIHLLSKSKKVAAFILKSLVLLFVVAFFRDLSIKLVASGELSYEGSFSAPIFYFVVAVSYGFIKTWLKNERERSQLELVKNQAELDLLKLQLQPHFLFNTMNNLLSMVNQSDNPKLAESIDKLSSLLRYVVYETNRNKVPIEEEVTFLRNYADLHLLRFEDNEVDFEINVLGTYDQQEIEPGIFLCYIENAFKHGVAPEEKSFISVNIDLLDPKRIHFNIENSIPKPYSSNQIGGQGLASNKERLNLTYPKRHDITINSDITYCVDLSIKI